MPTDPTPSPDLQQLWQSQPTEYDPMTLAQIHERAERLQARVRTRNRREYVAAVVVLACFAIILVRSPSWMLQLGAGLVIAAGAFVVWRLRRIGPSMAPIPSAETEGAALVEFHRRELIRQRDALRSVGTWYLAPFLPGFAMMLAGRWFQAPVLHRTVATDHLYILGGGLIALLTLAVIWFLNQRGANRLQRLIDEL